MSAYPSYRLRAGVLSSVLALVPSLLAAQGVLPRAGVGAGAAYEVYRFENPSAADVETLSLFTAPFGVAVPLPGSSRLEVTGAFARAALVREDGSESLIEGLTDTQVSLRVPIAGDLVTLAAIAMVPTGISTLSPDEAQVAGAIASDFLPFRVSNWGSGGGAGLGLTMARSFGGLGVGMGASYLVSREFEPIAEGDLAGYRPGDQLGLQVALDHAVGTAGKATLQLSIQRQSEDRLEEESLFRAGNRYQAIGSYAFRVGRASSGVVFGGGQHREQGASLLAGFTSNSTAQDLLLLGAAVRMPLGRSSVFLPTADGRVFRTDDGIGQGYLGGVGAALEISTGPLRVTPRVRAQLGRLLANDEAESGIVGMDFGITVSSGTRR